MAADGCIFCNSRVILCKNGSDIVIRAVFLFCLWVFCVILYNVEKNVMIRNYWLSTVE